MSNDENLNDLRIEIFEKISNNKTEDLKAILAANKMKVDFVDENRMSPLQHACYKGNKEIVQMLLDHVSYLNFFSWQVTSRSFIHNLVSDFFLLSSSC